MAVKINKLEIENVKRVRAVKMEPAANGLTIIGGNNNQGKTSVLDAIAWALGGNTYRPSDAVRQGSVIPPYLHLTMSNGLVVERKGKNSDLKITDPSGQKAGQQLLDSFVEKLALDLPRFMEANDSDKAKILLNIIGVGPRLQELEQQEKELYNERLSIGRIAERKKKFAEEQTYYPEAPKELVSAAELIRKQQEILAQNGENQRKRARRHQLEQEYQRITEQMQELLKKQRDLEADLMIARQTTEGLEDQSTAALEASIAEVDDMNRKVRANLDKDKAEEDARTYAEEYDHLTGKIEAVREEKRSLLDHADLPLPELTVSEGKLLYRGQQWDNMSGSDRLKVATAIVRKLNPECGFVLVDKLEQMDMETLKEFGAWLEQENLQVIATRVSTGEECSIIISDGYGSNVVPEPAVAGKTWKKGEF